MGTRTTRLSRWAVGAVAAAAAATAPLLAVAPAQADVVTLRVGTEPRAVAVDSVHHHLYVANFGGGTVSAFDTRDHQWLETIVVGKGPTSLTLSPDSAQLYVANKNDDTVSIINTARNKVVHTLRSELVGTSPVQVAVGPGGRQLYVANFGGVAVLSVSEHGHVERQGVFSGASTPSGVAVHPVKPRAYVPGLFTAAVSVLDTSADDISHSLIQNVPMNRFPEAVAVSPDGRYVYVTDLGTHELVVIDTESNRSLPAIPLWGGPHRIAVSPTSGLVFVTNGLLGYVSVVVPDTWAVTTLSTGVTTGVHGIAVGDRDAVYVTNPEDGTVSRVAVLG